MKVDNGKVIHLTGEEVEDAVLALLGLERGEGVVVGLFCNEGGVEAEVTVQTQAPAYDGPLRYFAHLWPARDWLTGTISGEGQTEEDAT